MIKGFQIGKLGEKLLASIKNMPASKPTEDGILHIAEIPYETGEIKFRYSRKMSPDGTKWIRDGLFTHYHQNGNYGSTGFYVDGLEEGHWEDYYENGVLAAEGEYSKGKEVGKWRFYGSDGELQEEKDYGY
ncbi:MAG: hypothetical protein LBU94_01450 [Clostridiales bacterium]|nr:hypothetical protein [Clostridiales bacterium]